MSMDRWPVSGLNLFGHLAYSFNFKYRVCFVYCVSSCDKTTNKSCMVFLKTTTMFTSMMVWTHFDVHQFVAKKTKGVGVLKHIMCVAANMSHVKRLCKATRSLIVNAPIVIFFFLLLPATQNKQSYETQWKTTESWTHTYTEGYCLVWRRHIADTCFTMNYHSGCVMTSERQSSETPDLYTRCLTI